MSDMYREANDRLNHLGKVLRAARGLKVEFGGVAIPEMTIDGRVKVACHYRPWNGPLHFCVPRYGGPCRSLGTTDQVTEVAGVVGRP